MLKWWPTVSSSVSYSHHIRRESFVGSVSRLFLCSNPRILPRDSSLLGITCPLPRNSYPTSTHSLSCILGACAPPSSPAHWRWTLLPIKEPLTCSRTPPTPTAQWLGHTESLPLSLLSLASSFSWLLPTFTKGLFNNVLFKAISYLPVPAQVTFLSLWICTGNFPWNMFYFLLLHSPG